MRLLAALLLPGVLLVSQLQLGKYTEYRKIECYYKTNTFRYLEDNSRFSIIVTLQHCC